MENKQEELRQAKKLAKEAMQRRERRFMRRYANATNDELVAYLRQCAKELGFAPNAGDCLGVQLIKQRLGPWPAALQKAGLQVSTLKERNGTPPIFEREVQRQLMYHQKTMRQLALDEAEFADLHAADTDEEILAYLLGWAKRLKHSPNLCEVVGGEYIAARFGSWERALEMAGLPKAPDNPPKRWHRLVYLDELKRQRRIGMEERRKAEKKSVDLAE